MGFHSMSHGKVSLFGNFGTVNMGNECTLQAVLHNISERFSYADINCICCNPQDVSIRHEISAIHMTRHALGATDDASGRKPDGVLIRALRILLIRAPSEVLEWIRAFKALEGRAMLLVTGTGVLTDRAEGSLGLPYQMFKWVMAAKLRNMKVLFLSVGVEPISHQLAKRFIKWSLGVADRISYRDGHSQKYMAQMGINHSSSVCPDLVFSLPDNALPKWTKALSEPPVVGVGLYDYCRADFLRNDVGECRYRSYLLKLSAFIVWLLGHNYQVRIIIGDVTYDNAVREDLRNLLEGQGINYSQCNILDEPISTVSDLLDQIAKIDLLVATRFHNVLLALMLNRPVISISYDQKNDALMEQMGLSDYCQTIDSLDVSQLTGQFLKLWKGRDRVKSQIRERVDECRIASLKQYSDIFAEN